MAIPIPKRLFGSQQKRLCNMRPEKGRKCYLLVVLLWSIHPKLMYGSKHAGQVQFSADWSGIWVSLKLKKTHYFVFCCGQTFVTSIRSIVKHTSSVEKFSENFGEKAETCLISDALISKNKFLK